MSLTILHPQDFLGRIATCQKSRRREGVFGQSRAKATFPWARRRSLPARRPQIATRPLEAISLPSVFDWSHTLERHKWAASRVERNRSYVLISSEGAHAGSDFGCGDVQPCGQRREARHRPAGQARSAKVCTIEARRRPAAPSPAPSTCTAALRTLVSLTVTVAAVSRHCRDSSRLATAALSLSHTTPVGVTVTVRRPATGETGLVAGQPGPAVLASDLLTERPSARSYTTTAITAVLARLRGLAGRPAWASGLCPQF